MAMSGNDSISLNNTVLADLADGDCVILSFPNEIATVKTGKNGNTIYGQNQMGNNAEAKIRVIRGSADDKFLNSLQLSQQANFQGNVNVIGTFVKLIGDGKGNVSNDTYILSGGVFQKLIEGKTNVEGDATQSVAEYSLKFASAQRTLT